MNILGGVRGADGPRLSAHKTLHLETMSGLSRLAERQIAKSRLKISLQGLKGEGKALPGRPGDAFVAAADAIGIRIMAEAGVLREEIILKKPAAAQPDHLATLTGAAAPPRGKRQWPNLRTLKCARRWPKRRGGGSCRARVGWAILPILPCLAKPPMAGFGP